MQTERAPAWPAYALAAAAVIAWQVIVLALGLSPALEGRLLDVDGYTHLVRAQELADGGGWYDITIDRSNAPLGTPMHWTRPFDLALLSGAYVGAPFVGFHAALFWWGVFLPAVLQVLCALLLVWAAAPLLDAVPRLFVGVVFVFQLSVSSYAMAGRPDHHLLLLVGFIATVGLTLRLLTRPFDRSFSLLAGAVAGGSLWLSIELLLPLVAVCGGLLLSWVRSGGDRAQRALWHAVGATAAVAAALAIERPSAEWGVVEFDRLSAVCLLPPLLAWMFWVRARALERRAGGALTPRARLGVALLVLLAAGFIGASAFQRGFFGSTMYKDPQTQLFFSTISENQPLLPRDLAGLGQCLLALGSAGIALACLPKLLRRSAPELRDAWLYVAIALLIGTASALALTRLAYYPEILATLVVAWLLGTSLEALARVSNTAARIAARTAVAGAILLGPLVAGAVAAGLGKAAEEAGASGAGGATDAAAASEVSPDFCDMRALLELLERPDALGERTHTILTHPTYGPEIMYRTPHWVVGSPDHRNPTGIHDCVAFFRTSDEAEAQEIVSRRGVDLVIACRPWLVAEGRRNGPQSMAARLDRGDVPAWLQASGLSAERAGDFLILRCGGVR